jgi:hypothetical protein
MDGTRAELMQPFRALLTGCGPFDDDLKCAAED